MPQLPKSVKVAIFLLLNLYFVGFLQAQPGPPTKFYCYSNNEIYILPLTATDDFNVAQCMLRYYFSATNQKIDDNIIYSSAFPVYPDGAYVELVSPICPSSLPSNAGPAVEIFKDINFSNGSAGNCHMTFHNGEGIQYMDMTPRAGTSFWQQAGGVLGINDGACVRNDEISSIRVPKGLKVICWENANYSGRVTVFTEDCANVGPIWNDIISSFRVEAYEGNVERHDDLKRIAAVEESFLPDSKIIPPHINFEPQGIYRIRNQGNRSAYLNMNTAGLRAATGMADSLGSIWQVVKLSTGPRFLLVNNITNTLIMSLQMDPFNKNRALDVICSMGNPRQLTSQWTLESVPGDSRIFKFKNVGTGNYLVLENGKLFCQNVPKVAAESEWVFDNGITL
jgi:hypothetical protein